MSNDEGIDTNAGIRQLQQAERSLAMRAMLLVIQEEARAQHPAFALHIGRNAQLLVQHAFDMIRGAELDARKPPAHPK